MDGVEASSNSGTVLVDTTIASVVAATETGIQVNTADTATITNRGTVTGAGGAGAGMAGTAVIEIATTTAATLTNAAGATICSTSGAATDLAISAVGGATLIQNNGTLIGRAQTTAAADTMNNTSNLSWTVSGTNRFGAGNDVVNNSGTTTSSATTLFDFGSGTDAWNNTGTLIVGGHTSFAALQEFNNGGGLVTMTNGVAGNTMTTDGTFTGTGASRLSIDTFLGGPGSASDLLTVGTATAGLTSIIVSDINSGPGALNTVGIPEVDVSTGVSDAAHFTLDPLSDHYDATRGVLDKGLVFYDLIFDAVTNTHLLVGSLDAEAHQMPAISNGVQTVWHETVGLWRDRVTDLRYSNEAPSNRSATARNGVLVAATDDAPSVAPRPAKNAKPAIWARASGTLTSRDQEASGAFLGKTITHDTGFDQTIVAQFAGLDTQFDSAPFDTDALYIGAILGYVQSDLDFDVGGASIDYEGFSGGLYGTMLRGGFFLDALVKLDLLDFDYSAPGLGSADSVDAYSLGWVIDSGWRSDIGDGFYIEPVATAAYSHSSIDEFTLGDIAVNVEDGSNFRVAAGLRLGATGAPEFLNSRPVEFSIVGRMWHEFFGSVDAGFTNINGGTTAATNSKFDGTFGEVKAILGFLNSGDGLSGFISIGSKANSDFVSGTARAGIRLDW